MLQLRLKDDNSIHLDELDSRFVETDENMKERLENNEGLDENAFETDDPNSIPDDAEPIVFERNGLFF